MEISRGRGSEGLVQGKDSKAGSSCILTVQARISYVAVTPPWANAVIYWIDVHYTVIQGFHPSEQQGSMDSNVCLLVDPETEISLYVNMLH